MKYLTFYARLHTLKNIRFIFFHRCKQILSCTSKFIINYNWTKGICTDKLIYSSPKFENYEEFSDEINIQLTKNMVWLYDNKTNYLVPYNRDENGSIKSKILTNKNKVRSKIYDMACYNDAIITGHEWVLI